MFSKLILCASPNRLVAGYWRFGRLVACEVFDSGAEGMGCFRSYLLKHTYTPVYLMVDAGDEDFRIEVMPHSLGVARRQMLTRKLGQTYRNVKYRATQFLGREKTGRKDDRFLFMALNNAESITPWLQLIEERHLPVAGIYLVPVVSQALLEKMKLKLPHLLFITRQGSCMRQTYFQNGHLCFSRTIPIDGLEQSVLANFVAGETEKTRRHLLNQRLIDSDTRIRLIPAGMDEKFCRQLDSRLHGLETDAMGETEIARNLGLKTEYVDQFPELLHMHVLAWRAPKANLADMAQRRPFVINRLRNAINLGGLAILFGGVALTLHWLSQATDYGRLRVLAHQQTVRQEALNLRTLQDVPRPEYSWKELKPAVELAQKLAEGAKTPQRLMVMVSEVLERFPEIKLDRLRWSLQVDPDTEVGEDRGQANGNSLAPSMILTGGSRKLYEIGLVEGEVEHFPGDNRPASESITRMADLLRKNKAVDNVIVVRQPIKAGVISGLQGNAPDDQAQPLPATKFKLKILLKQEKKS